MTSSGPAGATTTSTARRSSPARTLSDAIRGADVLVGLSANGVLTKETVASMADDPAIFALANPDPEVLSPVLEVVGVAPGVRKVAGLHMLPIPSRELVFRADTAVDAARVNAYPFSHLKSPTNVLVFSSLSAANSPHAEVMFTTGDWQAREG